MPDQSDLVSLYQEARSALKARDYDRASDLFRQILLVDENFKDASRLLAQTVRLRRRHWYNDRRIWGPVIGIAVVGLLGWLGMKVPWQALVAPAATEPVAVSHFASPTVSSSPMPTVNPTITSSPTPTPIPLAWKRLWIGLELPRDVITAIVFDPRDPDVVYVGTQHAGIYKTIDGGQSWQPAHRGLGTASVESLLIDAQQPNVLYAITNAGVHQTVDGGQNWQSFESPGMLYMDPMDSSHLYAVGGNTLYEKKGQNPWETIEPTGCDWIQQLVIQPTDGQKLLAVCASESGTDVFRSVDGGRDWIATGCPNCDKIILWQVDSRGRSLVFATNQREVMSAEYNYAFAMVRSLDGGMTWEELPNFAGQSKLAAALPEGVISVQPITGGAFTEGLYRVTDDWQTYQLLTHPDIGSIKSLAVSPHNPNLILASGNGLAISTDGGRTWNSRNSGLGAIQLHLQAFPGNDARMILKAIVMDRSSGHAVEVYYSQDHGFNWDLFASSFCRNQSITNLTIDADGLTTYLSCWNCARSTDFFRTWINFGQYGSYIMPHPLRSGELYRSTYDGDVYTISKSTDYGSSWQPYTKNSCGNITEDPYLFVSSGQKVYLAGRDRMCHFSQDDQSTACGEVGFIPASYSALAIDPQDENHLFLATAGEGVKESTDGCVSWTLLINGLGNLFVNSVVIDPNQPDTVYAGTDGGAYVTYDSGETWGQINDGLLGATVVYSILVDSQSQVYAATPYGIFILQGK
jgi:photosystem II stability/assembly factor-like uncharacterized protein